MHQDSRPSTWLKTTYNFLKTRKKSHAQSAIAFDFASHWLKNWCKNFKPITKLSNRFRVIAFDSHLKTAISVPKNYVIRIKFRRSLILASKIAKELKNKEVIYICWCQNAINFNNVNDNNIMVILTIVIDNNLVIYIAHFACKWSNAHYYWFKTTSLIKFISFWQLRM